jgi:hypothetical protein
VASSGADGFVSSTRSTLDNGVTSKACGWGVANAASQVGDP